MKKISYNSYTTTRLEKEFSTSCSQGISDDEVIFRRKRYGLNALQEQGVSWIVILLRQFNTPFVYLLVFAAALSFFLKDLINGLTITIIVGINGFLSFFQEYKAEQALKLLQSRLATRALVTRNGVLLQIPNTELVPGDLVHLKTGDVVPADVVICEGTLLINESTLTGESLPVKKGVAHGQEQKELEKICYFSSSVTEGAARGIVVATGSATMFGQIGTLTLQTIRESGFKERLYRLSLLIVAMAAVCISLVIIIHLLKNGIKPEGVQLLLFATALSLGLIPEALPAVITASLSYGALKLMHNNVLVKRLSAIEDLGALTVLCADKTGTLTQNKLSVHSVYNEGAESALRLMALSAPVASEDPFDRAIVEAYAKEPVEDVPPLKVIKEIPFSPQARRNSVLLGHKQGTLFITRGSFGAIEGLSSPLDGNPSREDWLREQAEQGNRVLAVAYKENPAETDSATLKDLSFGGFVSFSDPLRPETEEALAKASALGITVKMITGDSLSVAVSIARQVKLPTEALTGKEFAALTDEEKAQAVEKVTIFARTLPHQKYEIISFLKKRHTVGFLGEGINDAPALKAAHVGIVVQGASDIAQDAADIVVLNGTLLAIIKGISMGRSLFFNTLKYILTAISSTLGNAFSIAVASFFIDYLPLLPLQVLLINMLCDLPMTTIAADTVDPEELKRPVQYNLKSLARAAVALGITSSFFDALTLILFYHKGPGLLRTAWVTESILAELTLIYSLRTKGLFYKASRPPLILLTASLFAAAVILFLPLTAWGQRIFSFKALEGRSLALIGALVIAYFFTTEGVKLFYYRCKKRSFKGSPESRCKEYNR